MKSYLGLSIRYMKKFSNRTLMTCMGIILACALICSIGIIRDSMHATEIISVSKNYGEFHYAFLNISESQAKLVRNHIYVQNAGIVKNIGTFKLSDSDVELALGHWDESAFELNSLVILYGRMPDKGMEIMLEQSVLKKLGTEFNEGMKISLKPYSYNLSELLPVLEQEFTVTGVYKSARWNVQTGVQTGSVAPVSKDAYNSLIENNSTNISVFFKIKPGLSYSKSKDLLLSLIKNDIYYGNNNVQIYNNIMLLSLLGETEGMGEGIKGDSVARMILTLIIIAATVAAVYNIFHMSSLQRLRQFGILRCIGTSKRQITRLVLTEALVTAVISIPVGIVAGICLSYFTAFMFTGLFDVTGGIVWNASTLIYSSIIVFLTVIVSSFIPALTASKASPMQAVTSQNQVVKESKLKVRRWHSIITKIFGAHGKIAYMNLWRHKARFLITCFSLMLGITMFITFGFYMKVLNEIEKNQNIPGDYSLTAKLSPIATGGSKYLLDEDVYEDIKRIPGISMLTCFQLQHPYMVYPDLKISEALKEKYPYIYNQNQSPRTWSFELKKDEKAIPVQAISVPDNLAVPLANFLGIYNNEYGETGQKKVIFYTYEPYTLWEKGDKFVMNHMIYKNLDIFDSKNELIGKEQISTVDSISETYEISSVTDILPEFMGQLYTDTVILAEKDFSDFFGFNGYGRIDIFLSEDADKNYIEKNLMVISEKLDGVTLISYEEQILNVKKTQAQRMLFLYGLITVLIIIAALNMINTLGTAVIIRQREFGMLRAVGFSKKQLKRTVVMESMIAVFTSAGLGSIMAVVLSRTMYKIVEQSVNSIKLQWNMPWGHIVISFVAAFFLGFIASVKPAKNVCNTDIMDSIRTID